MNNVVIIGAGASGLTAAINLAKKNNHVIILEKNDKIGKKLLLTGAGQCNYFNDNQVLEKYHSNNDELISNFINEKNLEKVKDFFDEIGLIPKIKNGYYYPMSMQAVTVVNYLEKYAKELGVEIYLNEEVIDISKNDKFIIKTNRNIYKSDVLLLATGSIAYQKDKNENNLLNKLNIKTTNIFPSLVPVEVKSKYINFKDIEKIRVDGSVKINEDGNIIKEETGQIQLTNYGLSGICVMNLSGLINKGLSKNKEEKIEINFLPSISDFKTWIEDRVEKFPNRSINDILNSVLNYKLVNHLLKNINLLNKKWGELTSNEKYIIEEVFTKNKVKVIKTKSFEMAQTVTGGVPLTLVNNNLEVKDNKNLYVTGEVLDIDGDCGGYNLTLAWLTGILVGDNNDKN